MNRAARHIGLAIALIATALTSCHNTAESFVGGAAFEDSAWDDGYAVVSTFQGRMQRYGVWRDATVHDYLVREYLDPIALTKRDRPSGDEVRVLKANRQTEFQTGSYGYHLMGSYFFARDGGRLVQATGVCLNACGVVTQRWDERSARFSSDSYWENEGRAAAGLSAGDWHFSDTLPFVAARLEDGAQVRVLASLVAPRSTLVAPTAIGAALGIGFGDLCAECAAPGSGVGAFETRTTVPERRLRAERDGNTTRLFGEDGVVEASFTHDDLGHLESWTIRNEQEFERVSIFRGPYWEMTAARDSARVNRQ